MHHPDERVSVLYHHVLGRCVGWVGELARMSIIHLRTLNNSAQQTRILQSKGVRSEVPYVDPQVPSALMHHPDEQVREWYHQVLDRCIGCVEELASISVNPLGMFNNSPQQTRTLQSQVLRSDVHMSTHMLHPHLCITPIHVSASHTTMC